MADSVGFRPVPANAGYVTAAPRANEPSARARADRPRSASGSLRPSRVPLSSGQSHHGRQCPRPGGAPALAALSPARPSAVSAQPVQDVLRTPGQSLAAPLREEMEARLGAQFSDVRVHTGTVAEASAAAVGARAYTCGGHVVIGADGADNHTLAHELTHVIQQRQGPVAGTGQGSGFKVSDPADAYERAAEANADRVMRAPLGQPSTVPGGGQSRPRYGDAGLTATVAPAAPLAASAVVQRMEYLGEVEVKGEELATSSTPGIAAHVTGCLNALEQAKGVFSQALVIVNRAVPISGEGQSYTGAVWVTDVAEAGNSEGDLLYQTYPRGSDERTDAIISQTDSEVATIQNASELVKNTIAYFAGFKYVPVSVTVIFICNIGPCDSCKERIKAFTEWLGLLFAPASMVEVVYGQDEPTFEQERGEHDHVRTTYGYADSKKREGWWSHLVSAEKT